MSEPLFKLVPNAAAAPWRGCNFCGRTTDEVEHMVAGPNVMICDNCVDVAAEVLKSMRAKG